MKLKDLLKDVETIEIACSLEAGVLGISHDSRGTKENDVFVAIKGFKSDGNDYIEAAFKNGAAVLVTEDKNEKHPCVVVKNARRALAQMSANLFNNPQKAMKLIGITGTNGKTTSTYLVKQIIESALGEKVGLIGTNQNMIGDKIIETERTTPESYELFELLAQMRDENCQYVVMEISSHSLILDRVFGLEFEVSAFTNLSRDHLDFHGTMDEYALAKSRLFDVSATAVVNIDDAYAGLMTEGKQCKLLKCSAVSDEGDLVAKNIMLRADRVEFAAVVRNDICRVTLGIPGMFSVYNALTAMGISFALGISLDKIALALAKAEGVKGRAEVVPTGADFTTIIDYAHSPDSMENILKTARGFATGRIIAMFGCGGNRDKTKRPIMGKVGASNADVCVVTTDNPRDEVPSEIIDDILSGMVEAKCKVVVVVDRREAIHSALSIAQKDDVVLLMGKGHEIYQEIKGKKVHFDEREEIAAYFAKKD